MRAWTMWKIKFIREISLEETKKKRQFLTEPPLYYLPGVSWRSLPYACCLPNMPGEGGCQARSQLRWGGTPALLAPYTGIPIIVLKLSDAFEAEEVNRHSNKDLARGHVNALKAIQDDCGLAVCTTLEQGGATAFWSS